MLTEKLSTDKLIAINNVDKKPISLAVTSFTGIYRCFFNDRTLTFRGTAVPTLEAPLLVNQRLLAADGTLLSFGLGLVG